MLKTLTAIGIGAAIALAPLAAIAQTELDRRSRRHREDGAGQGLDEEDHEAQASHGQEENDEEGRGAEGLSREAVRPSQTSIAAPS